MLSRVTDLAVEVRESFPDDNVEISGVQIEKTDTGILGITMTVVDIKDEHGAEAMGKPVGNRYATPDMLGNKVIEYIDIIPEKICAIAPGVLAQTGMETCDIIKKIVSEGGFDYILVIDSLCSRHTERLCHTIQVTNTGISPGAGIGNVRKEINERIMGIPVIAIGVPTVVSMATVAYDCIEETLLGQGFSQEETDIFLRQMSNEKYSGLFVTPKDIDEQIFFIGKAIAGGLNSALNSIILN